MDLDLEHKPETLPLRNLAKTSEWRRNIILAILTALASLVIFIIDIITPRGVAAGVPYVAVIVISYFIIWRYIPFYVAAAATVLTIIGFFLSPAGEILWISLVDRALTILVIWVTALMLYWRHLLEVELRRSEVSFRETFDKASFGIAHLSRNGEWLKANRHFCNIVGVEEADLQKHFLNEILHPDTVSEIRRGLKDLIREKEHTISGEYQFLNGEDEAVWVDATIFLIRDEVTGRARYFVIAIEDIDARKKQEEQISIIMQELNHRVRNTLTIVLSIASQTIRHSDNLDAFSDAFKKRIRALSDAHTLLTSSNWEPADLGVLIETVLAPYRDGSSSRISLEGAGCQIMPTAVMALTLVFHELASNSVKYGALSAPEGNLSVRWAVDPEKEFLSVSWEERGGPAVKASAHKGFGSTLIPFTVQHQFSGTIEMRYREKGFECDIQLPWDPATKSLNTG